MIALSRKSTPITRKHPERYVTELDLCSHCGKYYRMHWKKYYSVYVPHSTEARFNWVIGICTSCMDHYLHSNGVSDVSIEECRYCGDKFRHHEEPKRISRLYYQSKKTGNKDVYSLKYDLNSYCCGHIDCVRAFNTERELPFKLEQLKGI